MDFDKDYEGYIDPTPQEFAEIMSGLKQLFGYVGISQMRMNIGMSLDIQKEGRFAQIPNKFLRSDLLGNK